MEFEKEDFVSHTVSEDSRLSRESSSQSPAAGGTRHEEAARQNVADDSCGLETQDGVSAAEASRSDDALDISPASDSVAERASCQTTVTNSGQSLNSETCASGPSATAAAMDSNAGGGLERSCREEQRDNVSSGGDQTSAGAGMTGNEDESPDVAATLSPSNTESTTASTPASIALSNQLMYDLDD